MLSRNTFHNAFSNRCSPNTERGNYTLNCMSFLHEHSQSSQLRGKPELHLILLLFSFLLHQCYILLSCLPPSSPDRGLLRHRLPQLSCFLEYRRIYCPVLTRFNVTTHLRIEIEPRFSEPFAFFHCHFESLPAAVQIECRHSHSTTETKVTRCYLRLIRRARIHFRHRRYHP